jgi:hypothetical protein
MSSLLNNNIRRISDPNNQTQPSNSNMMSNFNRQRMPPQSSGFSDASVNGLKSTLADLASKNRLEMEHGGCFKEGTTLGDIETSTDVAQGIINHKKVMERGDIDIEFPELKNDNETKAERAEAKQAKAASKGSFYSILEDNGAEEKEQNTAVTEIVNADSSEFVFAEKSESKEDKSEPKEDMEPLDGKEQKPNAEEVSFAQKVRENKEVKEEVKDPLVEKSEKLDEAMKVAEERVREILREAFYGCDRYRGFIWFPFSSEELEESMTLKFTSVVKNLLRNCKKRDGGDAVTEEEEGLDVSFSNMDKYYTDPTIRFDRMMNFQGMHLYADIEEAFAFSAKSLESKDRDNVFRDKIIEIFKEIITCFTIQDSDERARALAGLQSFHQSDCEKTRKYIADAIEYHNVFKTTYARKKEVELGGKDYHFRTCEVAKEYEKENGDKATTILCDVFRMFARACDDTSTYRKYKGNTATVSIKSSMCTQDSKAVMRKYIDQLNASSPDIKYKAEATAMYEKGEKQRRIGLVKTKTLQSAYTIFRVHKPSFMQQFGGIASGNVDEDAPNVKNMRKKNKKRR